MAGKTQEIRNNYFISYKQSGNPLDRKRLPPPADFCFTEEVSLKSPEKSPSIQSGTQQGYFIVSIDGAYLGGFSTMIPTTT